MQQRLVISLILFFSRHFAGRHRLLLGGLLLLSRLLAAQDTVYSHWPAVRQTPADPGKREALGDLMEDLLSRPASYIPPSEQREQAPGWNELKEARARLRARAWPEAAAHAEKSLEIARKTGNKRLEMYALSMIGNVSRDVFMGASLQAVPYHEEALALALALKDTVYLVRELVALADNYTQAGRNAEFLDYALRAARLLSVRDVPAQRMRLGCLYGSFLHVHGDAAAESVFSRIVPIARALRDSVYFQHVHRQLFEIYLERGDAVRAQAALDTFQLSGPDISPAALHEPLYQLEKLRGNREQAFRHLEQAYRNLGDEYTRRGAEQLAGWETRLHMREKELELEHQKTLVASQQKIRGLLFGLVLLVSTLLVLSLLARRRLQRDKRDLNRQNKIIEQQADDWKQLDRLKSRFFANVSHELRTPLTLILGPLEQLLQEKQTAPVQARLLETARRNALQLLDLVTEILDLGKLETTRPELKEQATVLRDFLEDQIRAFASLAESRGIELRLVYNADPAWTPGLDRGKLNTVIKNLLSNALRFTPAGGRVQVTAAADAGSLRLSVSDTGPGIHPDDLPHIFGLYYQSKRPTTKAEGGTGIGLTLSRELAGVMGGQLWAENNPGPGATFVLRLPVHDYPAAEALPVAASLPRVINRAVPVLPPPQAPHLLLVEDHADLRDFLRGLLQDDYRLTEAHNGREALDFLEQTDVVPDLIISDWMMPVLDGFQLLETLRAREAWRSIPVILLTARAEPSDRLRAFRAGIDDYLVKPFVAGELQARVANALRNLEARREWQAANAELPQEVASKPADWLENLTEAIRASIGDPRFNIDQLAELEKVGRSTLYRQIREKTGLSANQLVQEVRLQQARTLLENKQCASVQALAEAVGFRTPSYLSRLYRERFGRSPAEYLGE